jgi:hypothetical protein
MACEQPLCPAFGQNFLLASPGLQSLRVMTQFVVEDSCDSKISHCRHLMEAFGPDNVIHVDADPRLTPAGRLEILALDLRGIEFASLPPCPA